MIPINLFLILFLGFMLVVLLFTFFNVYHLVRFGKAGRATVVITCVYLVCILGMLFVSLYFISLADWSGSIPLFAPPSNSFLQ